MQDEEYQPEQIPSYGTHEQLALAARMRPQLRLDPDRQSGWRCWRYWRPLRPW